MSIFVGLSVWLTGTQGGSVTITGDHFDEVSAATAKFTSSVRDPKAAAITTYGGLGGQVGPNGFELMYH